MKNYLKFPLPKSKEWFRLPERVQKLESEIQTAINYIDSTYSELRTLINTSSLKPGTFYKITDYQTVYDRPDYDEFGTPKPVNEIETVTGPVEPLLVLAASTNGLARQVWSMVYPDDIILFDIHFTQTEYTSSPAKGRMLQRTDSDNNTIGYDHRVVTLKRYADPVSGVYNVIKDNGSGDYAFKPTFGSGCDNVNVWYVREETAGFDDPEFIVSNNVFGENCEEVVCGQDFYNNTIGDFCYGTTFNHWCHDNIIGNNFSNNTIANEFSFNIIANDMFNCQIQNSFQNNTIGTNFFSNAIGNNCGVSGGNVFGEGCFSNVIEDEFADNTVGDGFQHNYINDYFQHSTLDANFQQNHIKAPCNGSEDWAIAGEKVYLEAYTEVVNGFKVGGAYDQRFLGWYDYDAGGFQYTGL